MTINSVGFTGVQSTLSLTKSGKTNDTSEAVNQIGSSFSQILQNLDNDQKTSDNLLQQLAAGEDVDLGKLMIASSTTDINFKVAMAIRDRLVSAYQDISKMNV
jgi:flagellar hook-basal body complex protein FliE